MVAVADTRLEYYKKIMEHIHLREKSKKASLSRNLWKASVNVEADM